MQMLALAVPIVAGYVAHRLGFMSDEFDTRLSSLVLNVTLPCMLVASVGSNDTLPGLDTLVGLLAFSTLGYLIAWGLALVIPRLMGMRGKLAGVYGFMVMFGNVGFIGYPVLSAILGDEAVLYAAIANIPNSILVFSVGVMMVSGKAGSAADVVRSLANPTLAASLILLVLVLLGINDLGFVGDGLEVVGDLTTPAALLVAGSTLARYKAAEMLGNWRAYVASAARLLMVPLALLVVLGPLVSDKMVLGVLVIGQAMPLATNGILYCLTYGADAKPMLQGTFISIVASVLTIPLVSALVLG